MTTRFNYRDSQGRFACAPLSLDTVYGAATTKLLLKGLLSHVEDLEGLYKKSHQHLARRTYTVLRSDLEAVLNCFDEVCRQHGYDGQLALPFASGCETRDIGRSFISCAGQVTAVTLEYKG